MTGVTYWQNTAARSRTRPIGGTLGDNRRWAGGCDGQKSQGRNTSLPHTMKTKEGNR